MVEIKKVLFPCDFTENSTKILPYVLSVSEKYDSTIYLIHVVQDLLEWGGFYIAHLSLDKYQREIIRSAVVTLDRVCKDQLQGCPNFKRKILSGNPADKILETIEAEGIDLVIMGTHGRKGFEHLFMGSVAERVLRTSPVPVLVINPYKVH